MNHLIINHDISSRFENEVYDYIDSLPEYSVFYDLGACIGAFSLYALSKKLNVYSFEVEDKNYAGLIENYQLNEKSFDKNITFKSYKIGVADRKGVIELSVGQDNIGGHHKTLILENYSASPLLQAAHYRKQLVNVDTIDNLIEENKLPYPEYIKIDIDGSELAFMIGASKTLQNAKSFIIELQENSRHCVEIQNLISNFGFVKTYSGKELDPLTPGLRNMIYKKNV